MTRGTLPNLSDEDAEALFCLRRGFSRRPVFLPQNMITDLAKLRELTSCYGSLELILTRNKLFQALMDMRLLNKLFPCHEMTTAVTHVETALLWVQELLNDLRKVEDEVGRPEAKI